MEKEVRQIQRILPSVTGHMLLTKAEQCMILCVPVTVSQCGRVCFYADDTVTFTYAKK